MLPMVIIPKCLLFVARWPTTTRHSNSPTVLTEVDSISINGLYTPCPSAASQEKTPKRSADRLKRNV